MDYQIQQKNVNELYYPEDGNLSKKIQMVISPASLKLKIFYKWKKKRYDSLRQSLDEKTEN